MLYVDFWVDLPFYPIVQWNPDALYQYLKEWADNMFKI